MSSTQTTPPIRTARATHRGQAVIRLLFDYDPTLVAQARQLPQARWSRTMRCWYLPATPETTATLATHGIPPPADTGSAGILPAQTATPTPSEPPRPSLPPVKAASENNAAAAAPVAPLRETKTPPDILDRFANYMRERRFSPRTIEGYTECMRIFFTYLRNKPWQEITNADVDAFNQGYILKNRLSATYQSQFISAIKLFYGKTQRKHLDITRLERPRRGRVLPKVVSKEDIARMLAGIENLKHRAMLSLLYSCGLRRNELLAMRIEDIDSKRNIVNIRRGKGDKDRQVPLSPKILELLRAYFRQYRPQTHLFEGDQPGTPYSGESLHKVFTAAKTRAGIKIRLKLHGLRHCYATHLMEAGIGIRYIQELLGHRHLKTTEIYTHVSSSALQQIQSPYDSLETTTAPQPKQTTPPTPL